MYYYRVSGRMEGDDEAVHYQYYTDSQAKAMAMFMRDIAAEEYDDIEQFLENVEDGSDIFIDSVMKSATPIDLCEESIPTQKCLEMLPMSEWNKVLREDGNLDRERVSG